MTHNEPDANGKVHLGGGVSYDLLQPRDRDGAMYRQIELQYRRVLGSVQVRRESPSKMSRKKVMSQYHRLEGMLYIYLYSRGFVHADSVLGAMEAQERFYPQWMSMQVLWQSCLDA